MDSIYSSYHHQSKSFQPERLGSYRLRVLVRENTLLYVVLNSDSKILAVNEYHSNSPLPFEEFFDGVVKMDYFLKEDYSSVEIVNGTLSFSLIPSKIFVPAHIKEFAGAMIKEKVGADHLTFRKMDQAEATAIFSIPHLVKQKCDQHFKAPEYIPSCQPIMNMADFLAETSGNLLLLTIFKKQFVITGIRNGRLSVCNSYDYLSATDMVYFTKVVLDLMELGESTCPIMLQGDLDLKGDFYKELGGYLPQHRVPGGLLQDRFETQEGILPYHKYAFLTF